MFAYKTDIGLVRHKNEDEAYVIHNKNNDVFIMVFDGMGGHKNGDKASFLACQYMKKAFEEKKKFLNKYDMYFWLKKLAKSTNKYLFDYSKKNNLRGMGTTFSCYLIHENDTLMCYIGDSRCYLIKDNEIFQKSNDETYINYLFELGKITKDEMKNHPQRNVITNALGCYMNFVVNLKFIKEDYDVLLVCSDGLYNMINNDLINQIIKNNLDNLDKCADKLIEKAIENGGKDNIAVALYVKETANG